MRGEVRTLFSIFLLEVVLWLCFKKGKLAQTVNIRPAFYQAGITDRDEASCEINKIQYFSPKHTATAVCPLLGVTAAFCTH